MLNVEFQENETAVSFCSRLAAANEISLAAEFTSYFGVSFDGVSKGRIEDAEKLCQSFGVAIDVVLRAIVSFDDKNALLRGEWYSPQNIVQGQFRFCPHCLHEDRETHYSRMHHCYGRIHWLVRFCRSCPTHGTLLTTLVTDYRLQWDFAAQLRSHLGRRKFKAAERSLQASGAHEQYLLGRMNGVASFPWLDRMPLQAVMHFSELLGSAVRNGIFSDYQELADAELAACAAAGFAILSEGDDALRDCLRSLARANWLEGLAKPELSFGTMIDQLWELASNPGYLTFLGLLHDIAWDERGTRTQHRIMRKGY